MCYEIMVVALQSAELSYSEWSMLCQHLFRVTQLYVLSLFLTFVRSCKVVQKTG